MRELSGEADATPREQVSTWRDAWQALDRCVVPMPVLPGGYVSRGLGALGRLADLAARPTSEASA